MSTLHAPWLVIAMAIPALAAIYSRFFLDDNRAATVFLIATPLTLLATLLAGVDFAQLDLGGVAADPLLLMLGIEGLGVDQLNDVLLPFVACIFVILAFAQVGAGTSPSEIRKTLLAEALLIALFSALSPQWILGLLAAALLPELLRPLDRKDRRSPFLVYNVTGVILIAFGVYCLGRDGQLARLAEPALLVGVLIRKCLFPLHSWMLDLYERANLSRAVLLTVPQVGALIAVRLVIPNASAQGLILLGGIALFTAVYAAGLATVQRDAKRSLGAIS